MRLTAIVRDGLARGLDPERLGTAGQDVGDATLAYRTRQLGEARAVLAELERLGPRAAPAIVNRAYGSAIFAVDSVTVARNARLASRFGGIHQRAVKVLADNMAATLEQAAQTAGHSVEHVFERASALERGIPPAAFPFVGRRVNDPWRRVALDTLGEGIVTLDTRKQISAALARNLVAQGVSDALTGFVDRAGRRWGLGTYAAMVTRTTTREATSRAAANRMAEHGLDLVTVSSHGGTCEICADYDGNTYSLSGQDDRYEPLDELPPWHPNCVHVITPAGSNLDDYEAALEQAVAAKGGEVPPAATAAPRAPAPAIANPPLSRAATASQDAGTAARLEAEERRRIIEGDPGPDPEAEAARNREHDRIARMDKRAENAYMRDQLGPDLAKELDRAWARDADLRGRFLRGEATVEDVEHEAYHAWQAREQRAAARDLDRQEGGFQRGSFPCFVCGRRKPRPSSVCPHCGDDPLTYGGSAQEFDRAYGYSGGFGGRTGDMTVKGRATGRNRGSFIP